MNYLYRVELTQDERDQLTQMLSKGQHSARKLKRANLLLLADGHQHSDTEISALLHVSTSTIYRTKRRFVEDGLEFALAEGYRPGQPKMLDAKEDAMLITIACTIPPQGRSRWTLSLLANQFVALTDVESISLETVRQRLKQNELKPWQQKMWCIGTIDADYIAQMEHVLDIYAEEADEDYPVVNFDEAMKQLVSEVTPLKPAKPGHVAKQDYEYKREAVANIFMMLDRHRGWRCAKATPNKKSTDFAQCMRDLVDIHYPKAKKIRLVLDNFTTHRPASLYKAFPAAEARRILKRLEFNYTPKHASWLNMAEIEIGVMNRQCLDRRMGSWDLLISELKAWEGSRNAEKASINWMFDVDGARRKLNRAYGNLISQN
ncbi:MAG: IS630 family transposase [Rheinheimera sp.]|nr:IS630 family transposase [Rheinheimera sp.]MDZ7869201.1 IS630 family transposase [Rheinheimera sp.]